MNHNIIDLNNDNEQMEIDSTYQKASSRGTDLTAVPDNRGTSTTHEYRQKSDTKGFDYESVPAMNKNSGPDQQTAQFEAGIEGIEIQRMPDNSAANTRDGMHQGSEDHMARTIFPSFKPINNSNDSEVGEQ